MFKLLGSHQLETPQATCENCGHDIAQLFFIQDDETGKRMTVGSECVQHLLAGESAATADLLRRRMQRATAQWRKQEPPAKDGETRAEYINRRVIEMGNALKAHKVYAATKLPNYSRRSEQFAYAVLRRNGIEKPANSSLEYYRYRDLWYALVSLYQTRKYRRFQDRIGAKFGANRYDFTQAIWKVRKI